MTVGAANTQTLLLDQTWTWAGTDDPQYPRASIEEVVQGIPHATVRWYEGARHSIFRDRPEVNRMIRGWILGTA